jgi:long-chain acyl-CoA synthetase
MMIDITRTFDIIEWNKEKYPRKDMYGGKRNKEWITYSTDEVSMYVNLVSYGLLSMGYKKGDKIATISGNKPEWNFVDMGVAQAGMIHVPIYPTISTEEYDYILEHSDVKVIFVGNSTIYNKVSPIVKRLKNLKDIFSFDPVEGVRRVSGRRRGRRPAAGECYRVTRVDRTSPETDPPGRPRLSPPRP